MKKILSLFFLLLPLFGQTTGKISGVVLDKDKKDALPGANIYIINSAYGTASDGDGRFTIINIPPGRYTLKVDMIGYKSIQLDELIVSVNRTTSLDIEMESTVIEGEVVTVEVSRLTQKKDQTGTIKNISSEEIDALPVENIGNVINMQAGVVNGHFRGGRNTEVTYMIDGVQVDESYGGGSAAVDVQPEAVQDLEVITGTFNAEYGRAMSGVVNMVTRDGGPKFEGSISGASSSFFTNSTDSNGDDVFIGLSPNLNSSEDLKFSLGGPVIGDKVTFFTNFRKQSNVGHLNGYRIFTVTDSSDFYSDNPLEWISSKSGDSSYVPMNTGDNTSALLKLGFNFIKGVRFSFLNSYSNDTWYWYDHSMKYNPDGRVGSHKNTFYSAFQVNHMITPKFFYELKIAYMKNKTGTYLYEDSLDTRYVHDKYLESYGSGFFTGGQQKEHTKHRDLDQTIKFDVTWQANYNHSFKLGLMGISHDVKHKWQMIRNKYDGQSDLSLYEPEVFGDSTVYADIFEVKPREAAAYIQDKMEFENMVINFGIRYDYFDPASYYPSDRRNPANQLVLPDSMMSTQLDAPVIDQISPRVGFAYQLGSQAVLHFSYGHFFQMPPLYSMYQNKSFLIGPSDYSTTMGSVLLEPEKTITYEIGLWQELTRGVNLDVALFYRDIYNLLSTKIISTYNQIEYGLYSNKDYGNVRGLEVTADLGYGSLKGMLNYTLQYTRGNADNPTQTFDRAGNNMDPVNRFIPMSWDQRHTLNGTLMMLGPTYGGTITAYYNSGSPYTFSPQSESVLSRINLYPNNDYKPSTYTVDATLYYNFKLFDRFSAKLDFTIYNLLDRLNENGVDSETGRAYTAVIRETDYAGHRSDFNEFEDRIKNPSMFSSPRSLKLALGINF
ncbi:MAG: TonB-dependent receptor [Candidatus Marinimicrobia bacterium]|nr:TonB-dependent receptor [Candidatus Neomarinimicrobiota bacterium]